MGENTDITLAVLVALLALTVWGNLRLLCFARTQLGDNPSLQWGLALVCLPQLLSGVFSLVGAIIPVWAGGWRLGVAACEGFALLDNVLAGGANWMLALIILERYVKQCSPTEHSATFTGRNLRLLSVGVFLLQLMLTSGPFYGLGEYSYYRGKLPVNLKFNLSSPPLSQAECEGFLSAYNAVTAALQYEPLSELRKTVTSEFSAVGRSSWTQDGVLLVLRMPGQPAFRRLMQAVKSGQLESKMADCLFPRDVRSLLTRLPRLQTLVEDSDIRHMESVYLPVQALGLCTMDFTSANRHAAAGMAYIFSACVPLPLLLALGAALACHRRHRLAPPPPFPETQPPCRWELLFLASLQATAGVGVVAGLVFLALNLRLAQGGAVTPVWLLWATLGLSFPRAALYVAWMLGRGSLLQALREALCRALHALLRWRRRRSYLAPPPYSSSSNPPRPRLPSGPCAV